MQRSSSAASTARWLIPNPRNPGGAPYRRCIATASSPIVLQLSASSACGRPARSGTVLFLNLAEDPSVERLIAPRAALTAAEHLAFGHGMRVLAIPTDMTNYCETLREVAAARGGDPRSSGLSALHVHQPRLALRARGPRPRPSGLGHPADDPVDAGRRHHASDSRPHRLHHRGPDRLSRELDRSGTYPPIDVLPSLGRLMNTGIGERRTRADHRGLADQLYANLARGHELRRRSSRPSIWPGSCFGRSPPTS
jgi:V/A-type H+-transporting ATPase subunit B